MQESIPTMDAVSAWLAALPRDWTAGCHETVFVRAQEAYASPGRHYHTWNHVLDCVEKLRSMPCEEPRAVLLALVFHDAVYAAGHEDNEAKSAQLASEVLRAHSDLGPAELERTEAMILATQTHVPPPGASRDLCVTLDIDMSILGAPPDRYDAYVEGVRLEYTPAVVTAEQFAEGRAGFLARLLELPSIFSTVEGRGRWEGAARANIARELAGL
jgi:predicted metal-dependent HD superfamily phosphohydrolase